MEFGILWIVIGSAAILVLSVVGFFISIFLARKQKRSRQRDAYVYEDRINRLLIQNAAYIENADKNAQAFYDEVEKSTEVQKAVAVLETRFNELAHKYGDVIMENDKLIDEVARWQQKADKNLSQRKSSEVRTGYIAEKFAPFLDTFPFDAEKCTFIGNPLDYIVWEDDAIHFVEIKSGKSQLSQKQRKIKAIIEEGNVDFRVIRVAGKKNEDKE